MGGYCGNAQGFSRPYKLIILIIPAPLEDAASSSGAGIYQQHPTPLVYLVFYYSKILFLYMITFS